MDAATFYGVTKPGNCGHGYKIGACPSCNPEEPVLKKSDSPTSDSVETHPAYAQIGVGRVSGQGRLYGSEFDHQHFMVVTICRSELHRGLSEDRPHAREEYIEVAMSEAQWATFVSSPNSSMVQCTLEHLNGKQVSRLPAPKSSAKQYSKELIETLGDALGKLATLRERVLAGKGGKESLSLLDGAVMEIKNNIEFVAKQFDEHMEKTTEKAKTEINAYIQQATARAGLGALRDPGLTALGEGK